MVTILTHFTFESPIRKLCLRCCQSQLGIHFRTPLSGTWISQGKITASSLLSSALRFSTASPGMTLGLSLSKDLKAFLPQVAHRMMLCIPDHNCHHLLQS